MTAWMIRFWLSFFAVAIPLSIYIGIKVGKTKNVRIRQFFGLDEQDVEEDLDD